MLVTIKNHLFGSIKSVPPLLQLWKYIYLTMPSSDSPYTLYHLGSLQLGPHGVCYQCILPTICCFNSSSCKMLTRHSRHFLHNNLPLKMTFKLSLQLFPMTEITVTLLTVKLQLTRFVCALIPSILLSVYWVVNTFSNKLLTIWPKYFSYHMSVTNWPLHSMRPFIFSDPLWILCRLQRIHIVRSKQKKLSF